MKTILTAVTLILLATGAVAAGHCAAGKTLTDGVLTIATGPRPGKVLKLPWHTRWLLRWGLTKMP